MPELPEVEVAARNLRRWAVGRKVRGVQADRRAGRIFRPAAARALSGLVGARFEGVERRGKNLLVTLTLPTPKGAGAVGVWSHLGMTGKWLHRRASEGAPRFERLRIDLDDGTRLYYADLRLFGRFRMVPDARFETLADIAALGPDPLNDGIDVERLKARLARTRLPIKVAILDQTLLPGVGNIQASEGLFRAAIDPRRPARSLSRAELARLAGGLMDSIRYTLKTFKTSGADGADADIDYVEERKIPNPFLVYGRAGERCDRCGTPIEKTRVAGRGTWFCPECQRAPELVL
jgi:formamidopyrimidine-DNA glycosylase